MVGLFLNLKERKVTLYDGGNIPFSASTLSTVGNALVKSLELLDKVENRTVRVHDGIFTQNLLVSVATRVQGGGRSWTVDSAGTEQLEAFAWAGFAQGSHGPEEVYACIKRAIWGVGFGGEMQNTDNEMLGLRLLQPDEVEAVVARFC